MLPLRDLILISFAVSVPFSVGNITGNGIWISLGWLCLSALALLLVWRQPGAISKALSVLAAYLLVMSGRGVVEGIALSLSEETEGLLLAVSIALAVMGGALAFVGVGVYRRRVWALWVSLGLGVVMLLNILLALFASHEPDVSVVATLGSVAWRAVIWGAAVAFVSYLLRNRGALRHAI